MTHPTHKPTVYFVSAHGSPKRNMFDKLTGLLEAVGLSQSVSAGEMTAVKVHWGERGNAGFLPSFWTRHIVSLIKAQGARPFVTDTNTLYRGSRHDAVDNLKTAAANGFTAETLGAPLVVGDGLRGMDYRDVPVQGDHVTSARIASAILEADSMVVISHVKGHMVFGLGGAVKNLGMGCAAAAAKQFLHADVKPRVNADRCTACGACLEHCAFEAISLVHPPDQMPRAAIDRDRCSGCGECLVVCPVEAIPINWGKDFATTQEKTAEYAAASVAGKNKPVLYVNFLLSITPDCDCCHWSDTPFVPDIGIAASMDPVALDVASADLINGFDEAPDRFPRPESGNRLRENHDIDYMRSLEHAAKMGLGSVSYHLKRLR